MKKEGHDGNLKAGEQDERWNIGAAAPQARMGQRERTTESGVCRTKTLIDS